MPKWDDDEDELAPEKPAEPSREQPAKPFVANGASNSTADTASAAPVGEPAPPIPEPPTQGASTTGESKYVVADATVIRKNVRRDLLTTRIGILGGKQVGKSYMFQALVQSTTPDGILHRYLNGASDSQLLHSLAMREEEQIPVPKSEFEARYREWRRLDTTRLGEQRWYTLQLQFGTGLRGKTPWSLDIDFLDGSGEHLEAGLAIPAMERVWRRAFSQATIMVFCLPLWALFPDSAFMREVDWVDRDRMLDRFSRLVSTYQQIRDQSLSVRAFLALTMADDRRGALRTLRSRWLDPVTGNTRSAQLKKLKSASGIPRYLASAREVSNYVYREIEECEDPRVKRMPSQLTFSEPPWMVPMTAIDGERLNAIESQYGESGPRPGLPMPRPAHVELPLLAAMCECQNALM